MPRREKETEILEAAIKCIGRQGIENTNAQSISEQLGIAQSGVFYYFPKQHLLFDSLAGYIVECNHTLVTRLLEKKKPSSHWAALLVHIEGNFLWAKRHPDQVSVLLFSIARTSHNRTMKDLMNRLLQAGEDRIYGYLVAGVAEKEFVIEGQIRAMAEFIHKALIGCIISYFCSRSKTKPMESFQALLEDKIRVSLSRVNPSH